MVEMLLREEEQKEELDFQPSFNKCKEFTD